MAFGSTHIASDAAAGADPTQMMVRGDQNDTVVVDNSDGGWARAGTTTIDGTTFAVYNHGHAQLLVDEKVNVLM